MSKYVYPPEEIRGVAEVSLGNQYGQMVNLFLVDGTKVIVRFTPSGCPFVWCVDYRGAKRVAKLSPREREMCEQLAHDVLQKP